MSNKPLRYDDCFTHPMLGTIFVVRNPRAKHITFRPCPGGFRTTLPMAMSLQDAKQSTERLLPKLLKLKERCEGNAPQTLTPNYCIETPSFRYYATPSDVQKPTFRLTPDESICYYPRGYSFQEESFQQWLKQQIEKSLKIKASQLLPPRLRALAQQRGLRLGQVKISTAKTRWGSCNTNGTIHLNAYLLLLPTHLQDFVMHHELTHLIEPNHGAKFHAILNHVMGGKEKEYAKEMTSHHLGFS